MNKDAKGRIGLNGYARLVTSTIVLSALLSGVAMQQVHATDHAPIFKWGGEVEVRPSTLNFTEGNSLRYEIRLSKKPASDGWWVRIHVDGVVYIDGRLEEKGISWVPSVGWSFNRGTCEEINDENDSRHCDNPTRWRGVTINALQDADTANESVTITHELSDENFECPERLHGVARVSVGITDDDVPGIKVSPQHLTVPEGNSRSYTVKLNTQPSGTVRVSVSGLSGTDLTVDKEFPLTFTPDDWDDPQRVTVTAGQDDDAADDKVVLRHTGSGGGYSGVREDLEVTVTDNDTPGARVSKQSLTVPEEGSETYTLILDTQPTATVRVTVAVDPTGSDVRVSPNPVRFTKSNWNVEKTVTVRAVNDADSVDDTGITLTHDFNGGDYGGDDGGVTVDNVSVTITDNDDPGITLSTSSLKVREGASKTYRVRLDAEPVADVTVTIEDDGDVDVDPSSLMFTPQNWNSWKTVTVEAEHDEDAAADPPVMVTHRASDSTEYANVTAVLTVTIEEDDNPGVTVSDRSLTVQEGGSNTYTVVLDTKPSEDVDVEVTVPPNADVSVSPPSLTFTPQNWHMPKTFTVTADDDDIDLPDRTVTLTHDATGGEYSPVSVASVRVTVEDNDDPGITVSHLQLTVPEEGSNTYTVKLDTKPTGEVMVSVRVPPGKGVTADPDKLTFTTENWFSPQTVEVMAAHDDDAENFEVELSHSASGGGYSGIRGGSVKVTVEDNDTRGATVSKPSLSVTEGESETYTVVLHTQPPERKTVKVDLTTDPVNPDLTISPRRLTFSRTNWSKPKPVTVSAREDADALTDPEVSINHEFSDGGYDNVMVPDVTVTIVENDVPGVTLSTDALAIPEGETRSYTVVLNTPPSANVEVSAYISSGVENVTLTSPSVTFTRTDWSSPKSLSVTAVKDDNSTPDSATLSHSVSGASEYSGRPVGTVMVTITETDRPPDNSPATGRPTITGTTLVGRTLTAHTTDIQDPDGLTNVQFHYQWIRVDNGNETDISGANGSIYRLVSADAGNQVKVRVSFADDDGVAERLTSLPTGTVRRPAPPPPPPPPPPARSQTVTFGASDYRVQEGESVEVTVRLSQSPASALTIPLTANNEDGATDDDYSGVPENVVFDAGQTVATFTFRAVADDVTEGTERVTLGFGTLPSGVNPGTRVTADVSIEEDNRGVRIAPVALEVLEGGSEPYTVVLESEPTGPVTVTVEGAAGDLTVAPEELTFTTLNWSARQTVTVTAAEDEDSIVDAPVTLTHTVSGGGYGGVAAPDVEVTILENDIPGVTVAPEALEVREGSSEVYTVVLDTEPTGPVTVTVGGAAGDVTVAPEELTFTTLNWSTGADGDGDGGGGRGFDRGRAGDLDPRR